MTSKVNGGTPAQDLAKKLFVGDAQNQAPITRMFEKKLKSNQEYKKVIDGDDNKRS